MNGSSADLLLHPVRLRVVQAFLGGRVLTTRELAAELPEVSAATVYRHVGALAEGGVLEVVSEVRVRGAVERTYRLVAERASVAAEDLAGMTVDEHRAAFLAFVASLVRDMDAYLDGGDVDLVRDGVGYRQVVLHLGDDDVPRLAAELREVVARWATAPQVEEGAEGADARGALRRRALSTVLMPRS